LPASNDPVEQGRFADVGPADDCDYGNCQFNTKTILRSGSCG